MRVAILALALATLAACASPQAAPPVRSGEHWRLTHIEGGPNDAARMPTLTIDDDRAGGFAGCNRYFATLTRAGATAMTFTNVGATRMYCEGAPMQVETNYLNALSQVRTGQTLDGQLVLFGGNGQELLRYAPGEDE